MPIAIKKFDGRAKKPKIFERIKNIPRPAGHSMYASHVRRSLEREFPPRRVARLGILVRRIKPGSFTPFLDFAEHPAFVKLVLGTFMRHEFQQRPAE